MFALLVASIGIASAQTLTVTGTVVAESDGQPVVGAYVLVNGTTLGTITNENGELLSCYANGYWIDEYPWTDNTSWADNI